MVNYSLNEVVDILLTLGECNRNYKCAFRHYAELYSNRHHPSAWQVINIKRKANTLHFQRQINKFPNNNDFRLLTAFEHGIYFNPHISI